MRPALLLLLAVPALLLLLPAADADGTPDLTVTDLRYMVGEGETTIVLPSGIANDTLYRYAIYDDDDDFPEGWMNVSYHNASWNTSAAPFGDRDMWTGEEYNTLWNSVDEGGSEYLLVHHRFNLDGTTPILEAEIHLAFNNYCTPYLNGHRIFEERGYDQHSAYYWNNEDTTAIDPDWFVAGENLFAVYARDGGGGGQNRQWFDAEIVAKFDNQPEETIILGDDLQLKVVLANQGNATAENVTANLTLDGVEYANIALASLAENATYDWWLPWTPEALGDFTFVANIDIDGNVTETTEDNNSFQRTFHVGFYAFDLELVGDDDASAMLGDTITFHANVTNTGDVADNLTFALVGAEPGWEVEFTPQPVTLLPGETGGLDFTITLAGNTLAGNYNFDLVARSQYYDEYEVVLVGSGRDNATLWRWVNTTGGEPMFGDTAWTEPGFDETNWTLAAAPFGDSNLSEADYNTFWGGNNYAYFRHNFTVDDPTEFDGGELVLKSSTNNYGTHYLNGVVIFDDLGQGQGHGGEYWNDETAWESAILMPGTNILASVVRETGNTQWFDEELVVQLARHTRWDFAPPELTYSIEVLPTYNFTAYPVLAEKEIPRETTYIFQPRVLNVGNVDDTYDLFVKVTGDSGDFTMAPGFTTVLTVTAGGQDQGQINVTALAEAPDEAVLNLNVTITSRSSGQVHWVDFTARIYVPPNVLPPRTHMTAPALVNEAWFMVAWDVDADYLEDDTVNYTIFYEEDGGTGDWSARMLWDVFTNLSAHFHGQDGWSYRFACEGTDDADNRENKLGRTDAETLVDLTAPVTWLNLLNTGTLTNATQLELGWGSDDTDIVAYELQVRKFFGGLPTSWIGYDFQVIEDRTDFNIPGDGIYEFRMVATDLAGNRLPPAPQLTVVVDTTAPTAQLAEQPSITSADDITLALDDIDTDVAQYRVYYAVDSITSPSPTFPAWQSAGGALASDETVDIDLLNGMIYYFRALPTDEAGNSAYRGRLTFTYVGDGTPGQLVQLPLPVVEDSFGAEIEIEGDFTIELGTSPTLLLGSQCYLDARAGTLLFGNGSTGYQPAVGEVIEIAWEGYDLAVVVDRSVPAKPSNGLFSVRADEATGLDRYVTLSFSASTSDDIVAYRIYRSTNESETGILIATLPAGDDLSFSYEDAPGQFQPDWYQYQCFWYRIMSEDAVGHLSLAETIMVDLTPVENTASITSETEDSDLPICAALVPLLVALVLAGVYLWRNPSAREGLLASFRGKADEADLPPVVAAAKETVDPFRIIGVELMCNGCGRLFTPPGEEDAYCPGCGIYGKVPAGFVGATPTYTPTDMEAEEPVAAEAEAAEVMDQEPETAAAGEVLPLVVPGAIATQTQDDAPSSYRGELAGLTVEELKERLRERNLPTMGRKEELIIRLTATEEFSKLDMEALNERLRGRNLSMEGNSEEHIAQLVFCEELAILTNDELRERLREYDLPVSGSKEELISQLVSGAALAGITVEELRSRRHKRELPMTEHKRELIARLMNDYKEELAMVDFVNVEALKEQLRERGLPVTGRKAELVNRLKEDFQEKYTEQTVDVLRERHREEDLPIPVRKAELVIELTDISQDKLKRLSFQTVDALKERLRKQGLPVSGRKDELVTRLTDAYREELAELTIEQLKDQLRIRGLPLSGEQKETPFDQLEI